MGNAILPGYELLEPLGKIYGAHLCRAKRHADGLAVLVKMMDGGEPSQRLVRARREYERLDALHVAGIPRPLALVSDGAGAAIALEDRGGRPLDALLGAPMDVGRALRIGVEIAEALAGLHEARLVHRALCPANVFAGDGVRAYLVDLQRAAPPGEADALAPSAGRDLAYVSPEQTGRTQHLVDARSDLYALGVVLYRLLRGALPLSAEDALGWVHVHLARPPPVLGDVAREVPRAVSDVVMKLLAKEPSDRYQSARGLAFDLAICRDSWEALRVVPPFELGRRDLAATFHVSRKLYGREREIDLLAAAFGRVAASGEAELVLVSGYSGIGKSALVGELQNRVAPLGEALFAAGKFDLARSEVPYATIAQGFRALVQQILADSEERVEEWRARLRAALSSNGQLIAAIVPQIEVLLGESPPVQELGAIEAQNRFHAVFRHFLGAFARSGRPLVLFVDDLQWADPASLSLLVDVMRSPETRSVLVIGAYRDNEVTPSHPLASALDDLRACGARVSSIQLGPLSPADLTRFVAESLRCSSTDAAPLAELLHARTEGNPFFAIQFLTSIYDEGLLEPSHGGFRCDLRRIAGKAFTDNVVVLVSDKLRRLPPATRGAVETMACLGNAVPTALLATARAAPEFETRAAMRTACDAGLVLLVGDGYRFLHDRVQEAAYSLLAPEARPEAHLTIARRLVAGLPAEEIGEHIFEIASQWNRGVDLVTNPDEREMLRRLDVRAGERARASTAYATARTYFAQAAALLPAGAWGTLYDDTFALYLGLAECAYLAGDHAESDRLLDMVLEHAVTALDRANVHRVRLRLYQIAGRHRDAVDVVVRAAALLGAPLPESEESIREATDAEARAVTTNLRGRRVADLADAPRARDPAVRALIDLLTDASPLCYTTRPSLWPLVTMKAVNLSLLHGNADESPFAFACYAMVLVARLEDVTGALAFSEMAIALNERYGGRAAVLRGRLLLHHAGIVLPWCRHFAESLPLIERAFVACLEGGEIIFAGYITYNSVWLHLESGEVLDRVIALARRHCAFARQSHNDVVYHVVRILERFAVGLRGGEEHDAKDDLPPFDEVESVGVLERAGFGLGLAYHRIAGQITAYLFGRLDESLACADEARDVLREVASMPIEATHHFYRALAAAARHASAPEEQRAELASVVCQARDKHAQWAERCPANFAHRSLLLAAEAARIEGCELDAERFYEEAIHSAREHGFAHHLAIALEVAARFYRARGQARIAEAYLRDARASFAVWGAAEKARRVGEEMRATSTRPSPPSLDVAVVMKASQAISGEIVLGDLVGTLMRVVLESAGARRGALMLVRSGALSFEAAASMEPDGVRVRQRDGEPTSADLPLSILNYVRRTSERVLLQDAAQPNVFSSAFSGDAYFGGRAPKSILCLPILRKVKLVGLLYLENDLVTRAFTPDRLAVLEHLAVQAAISLENARLYDDLRRENAERRHAEQAIFANEALLRGILENSPAGIYVKDSSGRFLLVNRRLAAAFRTTPDAMIGQTDRAFVDADFAESARALDEKVLVTAAAVQAEEYVVLEDGTHTFLSARSPLLDESGKTYAVCGIMTDISERKRAEDALRRTEEQLRQAQKMEAIGNLAGGVAHDFNNLLSVIISYASMLAEDMPPTDERREDLEEILAAGRRAENLTRQLLAFGRKQILQPRIVDLNELVTGTERMLRRLIGEDIDLKVVLAPSLGKVLVDPGQVEQIILNLAVNSRDAMPNGGRLIIETADVELDDRHAAERVGAKPGSYVMLAVIDTGIGMDAATQERMFEPFFTTKERGKGTGLGLATVFGIVKQSGGTVSVRSEPGRGTSFEVYFPRGEMDGRTLRPSAAPARGTSLSGTETVLLVEDEERVRVLATTILRRCGYRVLEASCAADALMLNERHAEAIHLLVTDVVMPQMSGRQLAERICAARPEMKVLYMSGYADSAIVHHGVLEAGVAFLQKPITPEALASKVRAVLGPNHGVNEGSRPPRVGGEVSGG